ncbi:MAG: MFS transporter [Candidatus Azotimanducaceae bacterium WSBS_2022_MAG_OTU7]
MSNSSETEAANTQDVLKTPPYPRPLYAWLVVGILMLAYILSYVDRSILTLLVDPIKEDMGLSDFQISLLHGFAFAIFYSALGFPIGRIADVKNRVGVIAIGVTLWSLMTAACGVAKNFTHFFLARVGVGVGEASLNPASYSIITDYFPTEKLSRAISTYVMGTYLGFGTAYIIGGICHSCHRRYARPNVALDRNYFLLATGVLYCRVARRSNSAPFTTY